MASNRHDFYPDQHPGPSDSTDGRQRQALLRTDSPTQSDHAQAPDNREQEQEQKETDGGPVFAILFVLLK